MEQRKIRSGEKGSIFDVAGALVYDAEHKLFNLPKKLYGAPEEVKADYFMNGQYARDMLYEKDMVIGDDYKYVPWTKEASERHEEIKAYYKKCRNTMSQDDARIATDAYKKDTEKKGA